MDEAPGLQRSMFHWWVAGVIILFVLNVADLATTFWALSLGAIEGNPLSSFLLDTKIFGLSILIPLKLLIAGGCVIKIFGKPTVWTPLLCVVWWVVGIYSLTIVMNSVHIALALGES